MTLDNFVIVIATVKQRIREHGTSLRSNETRTRMALIDPLLAALGWDVSDPALVTPEHNVKSSTQYRFILLDNRSNKVPQSREHHTSSSPMSAAKLW